MRAVIVDDELYARQSLESILLDYYPEITIVGQAESVKQTIELIDEVKPELVFLDIDLPDGTGFDVLSFLKKFQFKVIFVTAHHEYAIKAIKFSAFDYILKPVNPLELKVAIKRVINDNDNNKIKMDAFIHNLENQKKDDKKIVLKTSDSIYLIGIQDIVRCEADNNYTSFFLNNGERIVISKGLKEYDEMLSGYGFFRVHQSHLINVRCISRFDKKEGGFIVLSDKTQIPVSQRKKQKLLEMFEALG
jgi:two-component system LytT family response regulator